MDMITVRYEGADRRLFIRDGVFYLDTAENGPIRIETSLLRDILYNTRTAILQELAVITSRGDVPRDRPDLAPLLDRELGYMSNRMDIIGKLLATTYSVVQAALPEEVEETAPLAVATPRARKGKATIPTSLSGWAVKIAPGDASSSAISAKRGRPRKAVAS